MRSVVCSVSVSVLRRPIRNMPRFEDLPYRPCVGTMVLNRDGRVFIGRRIDGPEHVDADACLADAAGRRRSRARIPGRRRCASSTRRPTSARSRSSARSRNGSATTSRARSSARPGSGKYRGQKQKWYALRFTGDEQRDRHRASGRRPRAGIRRMALGADAEPSRPGRAVQAAGLRAGGEGIREVREAVKCANRASVTTAPPAAP